MITILCVFVPILNGCASFSAKKKGYLFFLAKIGLFPATFIPMYGIICYSQQSVPESHMNVPHFVVICHFTFCHTHFDYVIIPFFPSVCAKFRMCFPKFSCTSLFYTWHIHILFGTLQYTSTSVPTKILNLPNFLLSMPVFA
jgi:hypothetical protein